jgi:signal transduction histidine kinase
LEYFDTGCGIPENIQARIFEPFFTTLRGRGGSGVGLNIVYTLVTQTLKGDILLDSHFKNGTKFVIRLPLDVQAML